MYKQKNITRNYPEMHFAMLKGNGNKKTFAYFVHIIAAIIIFS